MDIMSYIFWVALTFLVLWISYKYLTAPENPWKKAGITVVSRWDSITSWFKFFTFPLHSQLEKNYKKYGKLFGSSLFGSHSLSVAEPELIRNILVKDFQYFVDRVKFTETGDPILDNMMSIVHADKWKRIRNITSPTFSSGKIKKMTSVILECAETLAKNLEKDVIHGKPSDIKKLVSAFTMDGIASTAFSTKIDSHNDPDSHFHKAAAKAFDRWIQVRNILLITINNFLGRLRLKPIRIRFFELFENLSKSIIEERKKSGQVRNDFLQLMIEASALNSNSDDNDAENIEVSSDSIQKDRIDEEVILKNTQSQDDTSVPKEHKGLSEDEIIAQCIIFLIGGLETVSSTISFALYELALNENIQEELISEIDEVMRLNNNELTYENVQTMKYLDNVVSETLRKYPPGLLVVRIAHKDYKVTDTNLIIPKGTTIVIPVYAMHHDPDYFPNPCTFDPNRFTAEEKALRNPYVYLPFGAGPRNCVAMRFAIIEVKLCLAFLFSRFRFRKCSKTQVPLKFPFGQPQLIAKNIFLISEKREDAAI